MLRYRLLLHASCAALLALGIAGAAAAQDQQPTSAQSTSPTQIPTSATPQPTTPAAAAAPAPDFVLALNFGISSEYVFRGVSQTNGDTQGFFGADATYKQAYAGFWTSNVNFSPFGDRSTKGEIDVYGGWRPTFAGISLDVGAQYYGYYNQPTGLPDVDYTELYLKGTKAFGPLTVGASIYYSPEFTGGTGDAEYYEGNAAYTLNKRVSLSGAIGRQEIEKAGSYTTWNFGATVALIDHIALDLRYYDTDEHDFGKPYHARGVASLKFVF